jgi:formate dehydrogenase major subunit
MALASITIDDRKITAQVGQTILEAAREAGIDIPTLCHHPALEPRGTCRLCLVGIEGQQALQTACTYKVTDGMVVHTESEDVVAARKSALQLLLSERNHFCMYCQLSGDCELQSLAYRYGLDSWLYPRAYDPMPVDASREYFVMDHNRCILCRRCIRACQELVGNYTLGISERGTDSMIVADLGVPFGDSSCISCGTCLQVCPTGALMDRKSAYRGIEEDVERIKSTCAACSIGCGIELVTRDNQLLRIEGDWDAGVNQGVLCVVGRFEPLFDVRQRVLTPLVRRDGKMEKVTWEEALDAVADRFKQMDGPSLAALASPRVTSETLSRFAELFNRLDASSLATMKPVPSFLADAEGSMALLDEADLFLVVGSDLAVDHQVAGIAVRRGVRNRGARLVLIGEGQSEMADLAYRQVKLDEIEQAIALAQGADTPVVVYGSAAGSALPMLREALADEAQFLGLVPGSNARGALAVGLSDSFESAGVKGAFVLVADDEVDQTLLNKLDEADFVVAQASYFGPMVQRADVVLPTTIWAEKSGTFINTEGRVQTLNAALRPPAGVKQDQEILQALAERLAD